MKEVQLESQVRINGSKGKLRALRQEGKIPGVLYGGHKEPRLLSVDAKALHRALTTEAGANVLIHLKTEDTQDTVLVKQIHKHTLLHVPIHIDFQRISLKEKVEVHVPVQVLDTVAEGLAPCESAALNAVEDGVAPKLVHPGLEGDPGP